MTWGINGRNSENPVPVFSSHWGHQFTLRISLTYQVPNGFRIVLSVHTHVSRIPVSLYPFGKWE